MIPKWYSPQLPEKDSALFYWALFIAWGIVVSATLPYHEFWRDEVRALSYAMGSSTLTDLLRSLENEGHPALWHLLLYAGYRATASTLVLPVLSFLIAAAAVYLFIFFSPFPRWIKTLFVFSGLPIYEYSVMARNYGISMLLLFAFAAAYPSRKTHPLMVGCILAFLCNTNIHSLILGCLLMGFWMWDTFFTERRPFLSKEGYKLYAAMGIVIAGNASALYTVWPTEQIVTSGTTSYTMAQIREALATAIVAPATQFNDLFPNWFPIKLRIASLLWAVIGLFVRPPIFFIAYAALLILSVFFSIVYMGFYRHQGLLVVFLVSLYWIVLDKEGSGLPYKPSHKIFQVWFYGGLAALLASIVTTGAMHVYRDWTYQKSASKAFAQEFLRTHQEFEDAILVGEPDYLLEAVHYYAKNRHYIVREKRFGNTVRFVRSAQLNLRMGELLCAAWRIQKEESKPVLIVLGHRYLGGSSWDASTSPKSISYPFQRTFTWSTEEIADWKRHTKVQRQFDENVIGDEAYTVYSLIFPEIQPNRCIN
ncbi:MAG: hypothetical protein ABW047_02630 [Nitrospiraceae bacterium]